MAIYWNVNALLNPLNMCLTQVMTTATAKVTQVMTTATAEVTQVMTTATAKVTQVMTTAAAKETQVITTAAAQVGRAPWPARDALVPLQEAKRKPQCASHTKRCQTVRT